MLNHARRFLALAALLAAGASAQAQVVISQVNGNGGLGVDPFDRDFVELFNRGSMPVDLAGWSVQLFGDFGTATTQATPAWDVIPISGIIYPGQYLLIAPSFQRGSLGSNVVTLPLPAPDVMGPVYDGAILVSENNGVALMSTTMPIAAGTCPNGRPDLVDLFRYGHPNALCFEGSGPGLPTLSGIDRAVSRNDGGCVDGNDNAFDLTSSVPPMPRNSDSNAFVALSYQPALTIAGDGSIVTLTASRASLVSCTPLAGALTAASANLSALGLAANQPLFDDGTNGDLSPGDGIFSYQFGVPGGLGAGAYVTPLSVTSGGTTIQVAARLRIFPAPAANDLCSAPLNLTDASPGGVNIVTGGPFHTLVNNRDATSDFIDAGTCNGDAEVKFSVWYSFTAPANGSLRISENSTEDIVVSRHADCASASTICLNREDGGIPVQSGQTYLFQIGRETANALQPQVPLDLTFTWVPVVGNDEPCTAGMISAFPFSDQPWAPSAGDEPFNVSCDAAANPGARHGVWYMFTAPSNGVLEIFDRSINPTNYTLFSGFDCNSVAPVQCVDETLSGAIISSLAGGATYWLLVSYDSAPTTNSPTQAYDFLINFLPAPDNDFCDSAISLNDVGLPFNDIVRARAASGDPGVPTSTGTGGINACGTTLNTRPNGVWYTYTSSELSGTLRVADNSSQDVFYNVFDSCGGVPVQCYGAFTNDDIYIQLAPNTTYTILVGMQSTTATPSGDYNLSFTFEPTPDNDEPCNATLVTDTLHDTPPGPSATADLDVTCNFNNPPQSSTGFGVWYRVEPTTAKLLSVVDTSSDDLVIALFTGPACDALTPVDCKMGGSIPDDFAFFELQGGVTYWVLVGRIASSQPFGAYDITLSLLEPQGACCTSAGCTITTQANCAGSFRGPFTYCGDTPNYEESPEATIPDGTSGAGGTPGVLTRTITVTDAGNLDDLKVLIDLNHGRVGDLIITITGPTGATQDLIRRIDDTRGGCPNYGSQGRLTDMGGVYIFDDQSVNPYGPAMPDSAEYFDFTGLVVLPGHYQPTTCNDVVVNLTQSFVNTSITGVWTLTISDNQAGGATSGIPHVLHRWGLIINGGLNAPCGCQADFNGDGDINADDLGDFINCYFAVPPCDRADFNTDGDVNADDLGDFINVYFAGCP
ncbi:MAG: lamin tail domain-containing protein [Phycisphaerales bacterium]